jgi:glutathione S-transferase
MTGISARDKSQQPNDFGAICLYSAVLSMFGAKVEIALREKQLDFGLVNVPYDPVSGYAPKHPDILRVNPKRQVPVLIHNTLEIFDSTQIFEYLEDLKPMPFLWPNTLQARARARLLEHRSDEVYFPQVIRLMGLQHDLQSDDAKTAIKACLDFYQYLDHYLGENRFFEGTFSFADIGFFMAQFFGERMGALMNADTPHLLRWRDQMHERDSMRAVILRMLHYLASIDRPWPAYLLGRY